MGKLVLRKTILRNMIDRVWAALESFQKDFEDIFQSRIAEDCHFWSIKHLEKDTS
jgi:hypothetical protein